MGNCFVAASMFLSPAPATQNQDVRDSLPSASASVEVIRRTPSSTKQNNNDNNINNNSSKGKGEEQGGGGGAGGAGAVVGTSVPKEVEDELLKSSGGDDDFDDDDDVYKKGTIKFTYGELRAATKNFRPDQILGEGGFGTVYKGTISDDEATAVPLVVAVKALNCEGSQGHKEWLAEINYLGQLRHPNLVTLIGYCCEGTHRLLVYEYMACGSLEKLLFRRVCLTMSWSTRIKIALGAAKGLAFLHGAKRPIIYRDFKTSNILLDADYNAKLSDFGLAKEGPIGDQTHVSTRVMGTYGYAAPEYVMTGHLTARSDVYGFGVVLLEMLIGRKAVDKKRPSREHNLVEWARPLLVQNRRKLLKIVDPRIEGQYTNKTLQKVASLAYHCLSQNPKGRPIMSQVVEMLESLPESREDFLLLQQSSCGGTVAAVTLYEAPQQKLIPAAAEEEKKRTITSTNQGGEIEFSEANKVPERRRRQVAGPANGRSIGEPAKELQVFILTPDSDSPQPPPPSTYSNSSANPSIDASIDMYVS